MKAFLALTQIDLKLALRNRSVLFFNYFFPLIFFFVFGYSMHAEQGSRVIQVITMVTAIGILGNGLFGAGMRAVQDRETDVLRRYKVTPITLRAAHDFCLPLLVLGLELICVKVATEFWNRVNAKDGSSAKYPLLLFLAFQVFPTFSAYFDAAALAAEG